SWREVPPARNAREVGKCDAPTSPSDARRLIDRDQELQEPSPFDIAGIPPPCLRYSRLTIARRKPAIDSGGEGVVTSIERINVHISGHVNRHGDKRRSAPPHRTCVCSVLKRLIILASFCQNWQVELPEQKFGKTTPCKVGLWRKSATIINPF